MADIALGDGAVGTAENTRGQLTSVWDLAGEQHHSYDARGRTSWSLKRLPDPGTLAAKQRSGLPPLPL